jgi:hypothetical protein
MDEKKSVGVPWGIVYFIERRTPQLPAGAPDFLAALVAAMNDRADLPALDGFPEWRDLPAVPLDAPWPEE